MNDGIIDDSDVKNLTRLLLETAGETDAAGKTGMLFDTFGSFKALAGAQEAVLLSLGLGEKAAKLFSLIPAAVRTYLCDEAKEIESITSSSEAAQYLCPMFLGLKTECFICLYLNSRGEICGEYTAQSRDKESVSPEIPEMVRTAARVGASGMILAHNHPSGFAKPSNEDIAMTKSIARLFYDIRVVLCDHLIFSGSDYFSMAERGVCPDDTFVW